MDSQSAAPGIILRTELLYMEYNCLLKNSGQSHFLANLSLSLMSRDETEGGVGG